MIVFSAFSMIFLGSLFSQSEDPMKQMCEMKVKQQVSECQKNVEVFKNSPQNNPGIKQAAKQMVAALEIQRKQIETICKDQEQLKKFDSCLTELKKYQ